MSTFQSLSRPLRISFALVLLAGSGSSAIAQTMNAAGDRQQIFFAESPALLILINGDPVYRGVEGTDLERIVNTSVLIVRDGAGIHYLKIRDGWMEAYSLTGDWSLSGITPPGGRQALESAVDANTVDLLNGSGSKADVPGLADQVPTIFISSEPAELIVTEGPAQFQTVEGTSLEYLANTTANVFRESTDQELYVLTAWGWFRSWRTDGPWGFIPGDELPADIARICARIGRNAC
jgi:hypothetical protein